jgi:hypothetical protein
MVALNPKKKMVALDTNTTQFFLLPVLSNFQMYRRNTQITNQFPIFVVSNRHMVLLIKYDR